MIITAWEESQISSVSFPCTMLTRVTYQPSFGIFWARLGGGGETGASCSGILVGNLYGQVRDAWRSWGWVYVKSGRGLCWCLWQPRAWFGRRYRRGGSIRRGSNSLEFRLGDAGVRRWVWDGVWGYGWSGWDVRHLPFFHKVRLRRHLLCAWVEWK
jgi:hypothetical protein